MHCNVFGSRRRPNAGSFVTMTALVFCVLPTEGTMIPRNWQPAQQRWHGHWQQQEFCEMESFRPECAEGEVLVVTDAKYGRIRLGRCIPIDYGYVRCVADVLHHLDNVCSGRRSCTLRIPDVGLVNANACPREFKAHLSISYGCVEVETAACKTCGRLGVAHIDHTVAGYLASQTTTGCGSAACPWKIEVEPGQTIDVTLLDFTIEQRTSQPSVVTDDCVQLASITESSSKQPFPVCGGRARSHVVYSSSTNIIDIQVLSRQLVLRGHGDGQFLIYYEAVGCPHVTTPSDAQLQREGGVMTVTCIYDCSVSWQRRCVGTHWEPELLNFTCPTSSGAATQSAGSFRLALSVIIILVFILLDRPNIYRAAC